MSEKKDRNKNLITVSPIDPKEAEEVTKDAVTVLTKVQEFKIQKQEDYTGAAEGLKKIKGRIKILIEKRKEITGPIDEAKKKVMDLFRVPLDNYTRAEGFLKKIMHEFDQTEDRKLEEQQEKLRKQAEEKERKRKDRLEERAKEAEGQGDNLAAFSLRAEKDGISYQAPVLAPREKTQGIHYVERWSAVVIDKKKIPPDWMIPDQKALDKHAQNTKGQVPIPGVEFKSEKVIASRSV